MDSVFFFDTQPKNKYKTYTSVIGQKRIHYYGPIVCEYLGPFGYSYSTGP